MAMTLSKMKYIHDKMYKEHVLHGLREFNTKNKSGVTISEFLESRMMVAEKENPETFNMLSLHFDLKRKVNNLKELLEYAENDLKEFEKKYGKV